MSDQICQLAHIAQQAISEAVHTLKHEENANCLVMSSKGRDIKLEADALLHRELTRRLEQMSGIPCLSEENVSSHNLLAQNVSFWIVDPLDGSMNFSRRIPLCCISLALWYANQAQVGIVYDFIHDDWFVGYSGHSFLNDSPISVGHIERTDQAVLASGFPVGMDLNSSNLSYVSKAARNFKKIRMLGSAALSMAWVAAGRVDAYFEKDIMLWDIAAGAALVQGAGGEVILVPGESPVKKTVMAANRALISEMEHDFSLW